MGIAGLWFFNQGQADWLTDVDALPWVVLSATVLAALVVLGGYISWRFHTYRITDDAIEQRKGVLFKQQRQARLDRLQAVDVVQPWQARVLGFAKISVEVAGGEGSAVSLEYLRLGHAEALRNEIVALAAGVKARKRVEATEGDPEEAAEQARAAEQRARSGLVSELRETHLGQAPDTAPTLVGAAAQRELIRVPVPRLLESIVRSAGFVTFAVMLLVFAIATVVIGVTVPDVNVIEVFFGGGFVGFVSAAFGGISYGLSQLNRGVNFRLAISQDGVRLAHGLLELRRQTVPPGRVQAVHLKQGLLWRGKDWWTIVINVAGYQDQQVAVSTLLPVGSREEALTALWTVLPDLGDPDPEGTISRALSGTGHEGGFTPAPRSARWVDPLQRRHRGVKATDTALLIRQGRWTRELVVVPHERTQSLKATQSPVQRWLGIADLQVHSTKGSIAPVAKHLSEADAQRWLDEQAARARTRRSVQTPEQWMAKVGIDG